MSKVKNAVMVSEIIRQKLQEDGKRFWAGDNISEYIGEEDKSELIDELTEKFEGVLDSLLIDRHTDPNSMDTPRRLAKMYINEIMGGRYEKAPKVTAFPNTDEDSRYGGIIVTRAELISMCSHHHQPVKGVAYIGLIPSVKMIGLSKYARIAQWCAARGTLQEELTMVIANELQKATATKDLAVYVQATHGCMEHRGVLAHSSLTQTTELRGQFFNPSIKNEFLDYIKMQQQFAGTRT
jgi:GTP cyclohydrolase I